MVQGEEGEVISRVEVFNSVEVLAPGIELDDLDSLLNSGESNYSSTVLCIKYVWKYMLISSCHHHVCTSEYTNGYSLLIVQYSGIYMLYTKLIFEGASPSDSDIDRHVIRKFPDSIFNI
jgi:hypothetical protein